MAVRRGYSRSVTSPYRQVIRTASVDGALAAPQPAPSAVPLVPVLTSAPPEPRSNPRLAFGAAVGGLVGLFGLVGLALPLVSQRRESALFARRRHWLGAALAATILAGACLTLATRWRSRLPTEVDLDEDPPLFV